MGTVQSAISIASLDFHDLYISSDKKLFNNISTCPNHILRTLLPPSTAQNYSLRNRPHSRQLPDRISRITDCNFTVRMLYRNMYWLLYILDLRFVLFLCTTAVWQFAINEYVMLFYFMLWQTAAELPKESSVDASSHFCLVAVCVILCWYLSQRQNCRISLVTYGRCICNVVL